MPVPAATGVARCAECQLKPLPLERVLAPLRYEFPVDAAIQAIKFRRRLEFVPALASIMAAALEQAGPDVDAVIPVPLHYLRHGARGYNQAEELARPIARSCRLPMRRYVVRGRRTRAQSGLGATERRRNLRHAFRANAALYRAGAPRHALIVDDVMTTGTTILELARCLQAAGVERVSALVAARPAAPVQATPAKV